MVPQFAIGYLRALQRHSELFRFLPTVTQYGVNYCVLRARGGVEPCDMVLIIISDLPSDSYFFRRSTIAAIALTELKFSSVMSS